MTAKQSSQKDKQSGTGKQQEANLGQKEARQEKEKKSELSSMGEGSRESSHEVNQKHDSDQIPGCGWRMGAPHGWGGRWKRDGSRSYHGNRT
jgi:hypothetical protein